MFPASFNIAAHAVQVGFRNVQDYVREVVRRDILEQRKGEVFVHDGKTKG